MKISQIREEVAMGATSSADIAGGPSLFGGMSRRDRNEYNFHRSVTDSKPTPEDKQRAELDARRKANLTAAKAKLARKRTFLGRLKAFLDQKQNPSFRISESFDMQDVISRLSSLENENDAPTTVSYGIEDDEGNLMKITVRSEQAKEFEERLANELADAARRKEVTGEKTAISMAELLLKLNDEFDIVDAAFPTIPTDAVYNADKVQYGIADTASEDVGGDDGLDAFPDDQAGQNGDIGGMGGQQPQNELGGMDDNGLGATPEGGPEAGIDGAPVGGGSEGGAEGGDDQFFDDGSVEEFPEEGETENPQDNMLTAILKMLTADAESRKAEAEAKAEEARAKQAEYSALAAKNAVSQQEEVMRMEAEIEQQKKQEKEAKRISDLARYRVNKANSFTEGVKPTFGQYLNLVLEFEEFDSVQSLNKQRAQVRQKYAISPGDDVDTIRYKREALATSLREIDAKIRHAQAAERYKQSLARKNKTTVPPQQNPQTNQGQPVQGQPQQNAPGQPQGLPDGGTDAL